MSKTKPVTGADVKRERGRAGLTQTGLAKTVGVSRRTIAEWEASDSLSPEIQGKLSKVFGGEFAAAPDEHPGPSLTGCSDGELAAEFVKRLARRSGEF